MPNNISGPYNKIAKWWHQKHEQSHYGISQLERAISYGKQHRTALDVGCGSGGRMIKKLESLGFRVTGIDISAKMLEIATEQHPSVQFIEADICDWESPHQFDLIFGWDSLFHLPFEQHAKVIPKLCRMLTPDGILAYTFGDDYGEHESIWLEETFYYSSIGISGNLQLIMEHDCTCRHLELDQFPEKHVFIIVQKNNLPTTQV